MTKLFLNFDKGREKVEIIAQRVFNTLYIYLDTGFLILFCGLLFFRKRYLTLLFALAGGVLYMLVDYGIFHLVCGARSIEGGNLFLVLLWMSMSYGITNFAFLWLWMKKDEHLLEWSLLIWAWWLCAPMLAETFGQNFSIVTIQRTTGAYHGYMALILFFGYGAAIAYNFLQTDRIKRFPLPWLLAGGILAQFAWEAALLIGGIRSAEFVSVWDKLMTLAVNSLLETNLGAVPIFCIYALITSRLGENLTRRTTVCLTERIAELNKRKVRDAEIPFSSTPQYNKGTDSVVRSE